MTDADTLQLLRDLLDALEAAVDNNDGYDPLGVSAYACPSCMVGRSGHSIGCRLQTAVRAGTKDQ